MRRMSSAGGVRSRVRFAHDHFSARSAHLDRVRPARPDIRRPLRGNHPAMTSDTLAFGCLAPVTRKSRTAVLGRGRIRAADNQASQAPGRRPSEGLPPSKPATAARPADRSLAMASPRYRAMTQGRHTRYCHLRMLGSPHRPNHVGPIPHVATITADRGVDCRMATTERVDISVPLSTAHRVLLDRCCPGRPAVVAWASAGRHEISTPCIASNSRIFAAVRSLGTAHAT
jgi:hypothetical protein